MSIETAASLFIVPPLQRGFYQQLLTSVISFQELGNRLIRHAHQAKAFRKSEEVRQAAEILCNLPIKDYQVIGQYYLAWCERKTNPQASKIFENIAATAPAKYRAFALHSLAALAARNQDHEAELYWFIESLKVHPLPEALKAIAVIKAKEGYHKHALKDLERILPLMKYAPPHIYFDYLNSLAVELAEAGRKYEARNVIRHVLEFPLIIAYPEWQETARELKEPDRSFISVPQVERKPVEIKPKPITEPEQETKPADVLPFTRPKEAPPPPKPERIPEDVLDRMTVSQKSQLVMSLVQSKTLSSYGYKKMLASVGMVKRGASAKEIELEDHAFMADLISDWCNMIDPWLFSEVMSAIRDCDDRVRQRNVIDLMISEAFRQTDDSTESEEQWRRKTERRLPKE